MTQLVSVLLAQLLVLLGGGGVAVAAPAGNQRFFAVGRVEDPALTIVASGVIAGVGSLTAESVELRPVDLTYHETDRVGIGGGTLTVSVDGRFDVWPFTLDPRSCTRQGSLAGTWTIAASGGDFAGATGGGTFSGHFITYAARGPGGCDEAAIKGVVAGRMVGAMTLPPPVW
ncbi:MAG TPA: hypothetical protein VLJ59_09100 [Mycobacteriales bacterium]|nr:hypothetical protein [Mycobacteriales bacterium]